MKLYFHYVFGCEISVDLSSIFSRMKHKDFLLIFARRLCVREAFLQKRFLQESLLQRKISCKKNLARKVITKKLIARVARHVVGLRWLVLTHTSRFVRVCYTLKKSRFQRQNPHLVSCFRRI